MLALAFAVYLASAESAPAESTSRPATQAQPTDWHEVENIEELSLEALLVEEKRPVVAGSSRASTMRESPSSVWAIDRRTLRLSAALSLYDLMRTIPGTLTREEGAGQQETNLRFRGSMPRVRRWC